MQVWNKNRPTPTPSTKHLTDEELKLQYGIHMTSRIQADGEGKEAKWADIDDDEDDWAPETIEWNDGTKISLGQADLPTPSKEVQPSPTSADSGRASPAKKVLVPQVINSVGPNATILKIGQNAEKQAKAAASQPKGPVEKPIMSSSKAAAPPPSKSPWAPLPPVSKSPITIQPEPSTVQQRSYFPSPGQQPPQQAVMQSPAQEISADDFNRNWRDAQTSGPRELFMPNSGRYEAVSERRRPSRHDPHFRQPSVLQRPSANDVRAPAEPSAAFQTSRVSADQERGQWGRRRASSNVSGGSGQFARRMSVGKPNEAPIMTGDYPQQHQRRGSKTQSISSHVYQALPEGVSPSQLSAETKQLSHDSPRLSHVSSEVPASPSLQNVDTGAPIPPQEDVFAVQKRLMVERRELARKRRQEEEEREEAAKRERIRLKLEALGPPPPSKTQKAEAAPETIEVQAPASEDSVTSPQSPPKPPVPEASGEPKQYGMMKVHHPDSVKRMMPQSGSQQSSSQQRTVEPMPSKPQSAPLIQESRSDPLKPTQPLVNGVRQNSDDMLRQVEKLPEAKSNEGVARGWTENTGNGSIVSPWAAPSTEQQPKVSLWGSTNNALGNGTFDRSLAEFAGTRGQLPPPGQPGRSTLWAHERSPFPTVEQPQKPSMGTPEISQAAPSYQSPEERPMAANSEVDSVQPTSRPLPIGPPQMQPTGNVPTTRLPPVGITAWNNFHNVAASEDRAANEKYRRELATRLEEEAKTGIEHTTQVAYNETWRQVNAGDHAGQRQIVGVTRSNAGPAQAIPNFGSVGSSHPDTMSKTAGLLNGGQKASRFFPSGSINEVSPQDRRAITYSHSDLSVRPGSPSPPPPEEFGHPAFTGNILRPNVSLPRPKAVVRLPPKETPQTPAMSSSPAPQTWSAVVGQRTLSSPTLRSEAKLQGPLPSWQSRFNALLDKKELGSDKKHALAVASSTKDMLDVLEEAAMTVSFPSLDQTTTVEYSLQVTSKNVEDEDEIFEDRVAGSLPVVRVPTNVSAQALQQVPHNRHRNRFVKHVEPSSFPIFTVDNEPTERDTIVIHLPGNAAPRKSIPFQRVDQGDGGSKPARNNHNKSRRVVPKSRESSGSFKPQHSQNQKASGMQQTTRPTATPPRTSHSQHHNHNWRGSRQAAGVAH